MNKLYTILSLAFGSLLLVCCKKEDSVTTMADVYHYSDATTTIALPTAFTPGGDGRNDLFRPIIIGTLPKNYRFLVYDMNDRLVSQSLTKGAGWNGYNNATFAWYGPGTYRANLAFTASDGTTMINENFFFTLPPYNQASNCWRIDGLKLYFEDQIDPNTGAVVHETSDNICHP